MATETINTQNTPNILIVDDVAANLKVLGDILKTDGYKVRPVPNGILALQVAKKEKPDLILLDIMMPDMDGFEVCRRLKEIQELQNVPIIFISALNDTSDIVKALSIGGVDYITKPFQAEEVKARVATHIKIHQQSKELQKLMADKDRFISILGHDLKSPFNSILGLSSLLKTNIRDYDVAEIEDFADLINKAAQSTYTLLEDLLTWARTQSGKLPFEPQYLNLAAIFYSALDTLKLNAQSKNITINYLAERSIEVFADVNMLQTVLRNLLSNAIKFTRTGDNIEVYAEVNQKTVTIIVSDNGIGMEQKNVVKLFDITQKYTSAGTANEKGTGLGLLLCKDFVEKHGGKIWVESEVGKGSDFKFSLPIVL